MKTKAIIGVIAALAVAATVVVWTQVKTGREETSPPSSVVEARIADVAPTPSPVAEAAPTRAPEPAPTPVAFSESFAFQTHEFDGERVPVWGARVKRIPWGEVHYAFDVDGAVISDPLNPNNTGEPAPERYWVWRQMEYPSYFKYPLPEDHTAESPRAAGKAVEFIYKGHIERWVILRAHFLGDAWSTVDFEPLNQAARENLKEIKARRDLSSVRGQVIDHHDRPVPFAKVLVRTDQPETRKAYFLRALRCDREGRFEVDRLLVGPGMMWAEADGYQHFRDNAIMISPKGLVREVTVRLEPTVMVSGTLRNLQGRPVAGARILTFPSDDMGGTYPLTRTDAHGVYRFNTLRKETYNFVVMAGARGMGSRPGIVVQPDGPDLTVDLTVGDGASACGKVVREIDGREESVEGARVSAGVGFRKIKGWKSVSGLRIETVSGPDGTFTLNNLPTSGSLSFHAIKGFCYGWVRGVKLSSGNAPPKPSVIKLPAPARIPGVVLDADGKPVRGATVTIEREEGYAYWHTVTTALVPVLTTDAEGRFLISDVRPGNRFTLSAHADGYAKSYARDVSPVPFGKEDGDPTEIRLVRGGTLEGTVVDSAEKKPIEGFVVTAVRENQKRWGGAHADTVETDGAGKFRLENVTPGNYRVTGWAELPSGGEKHFLLALAPGSVSVRDGQATTVDLTAGVGSALRGHVIEKESGDPIAGADVRLTVPSGLRDALRSLPPLGGVSRKTDDSGEFDFDPLPAGAYELRPNKRDHVLDPEAGSKRIQVGEGEIREGIELTLMAGGTIEGFVRDKKGNPVGGIRLVARTARGNESQYATTSGDGAFTVKGLLYRTPYFLTVYSRGSKGYCGESEPITIDAKNPVAQTVFVVSKGGTISGRVTDEAGAALSGVNVYAYPEHHYSGMSPGRANNSVSGETDADGKYELTGLFDGSFQLGFHKENYQRETMRGVSVKMDEVTVKDLQMKKGRTFEGTLTDSNGEKMEGWHVSARSADGQQGASGNQTDTQGRFTLKGLGEGEYVFHFGMYSHSSSTDSGPRIQAQYVSGAIDVSDEAAPNVFIVDMDCALTGRLLREETQEPITGLRISMHRNYFGHGQQGDGARCALQYASVNGTLRSDSEGRFSVDPLPEGTYSLTLSGEGVVQHRMSDVEVKLPAPTDLGDILLAAGRVVVGRFVEAQTGEPMVFFEGRDHVYAYCQSPSKGSSHVQVKMTGEPGRFRMEGVPSDVESMRFQGQNVEMKTLEKVELSASGETDLGDVPLEKALRMVGRFVDKATGEPFRPAPGQTYHAECRGFLPGNPRSRHVSMSLQAGGRFEVQNPPKGLCRLELRLWGALPVEIDKIPEPDENRKIDLGDIEVNAGSAIRGTVLDSEDTPVVGASIQAYYSESDGNRRYLNGNTLGDGTYAITGVPAGEVHVTARHGDYATSEERVATMPRTGDLEKIDFVLGKGVAFKGTLMDYNADPLANWQVSLQNGTQGGQASSRTGRDGTFELPHVTPGEYTFYFHMHKGSEKYSRSVGFKSATVTVPGGDGEFLLPLGAEIRGRVVSADTGRPVEVKSLSLSIQSSIKPEEGIGALSNFHLSDRRGLGSSGRLELKDLPAGEAQLTIELESGPRKQLTKLALSLEKPLDLGDIEIDMGAPIVLKLVDSETGKAIVPDSKSLQLYASVPGASGSRLRIESVESDGEVRALGASRGSTSLSINLPGYSAKGVELKMEEKGDTDLGKVEMDPSYRLRVRYVEADGGGIYTPPKQHPQVQIRAINEAGHQIWSSTGQIQDDGSHLYQNVPKTVKKIRVIPHDRLSVDIEKVPDPDDDGLIKLDDVKLEKGASLRIKLEGPNGETVRRAQVNLKIGGESGSHSKSQRTDANGEVVFEGLAAGSVQIEAYAQRAQNDWIPEGKQQVKLPPHSMQIGEDDAEEVTLRFPETSED